MKTLDFNPPRTICADWWQHQRTIVEVRNSCGFSSNSSKDALSQHFITFVNDTAVACASISQDHELYHLVVLPEYRSQNIASALMRFLLKEAPKLGANTLRLTCPTDLKTFFEKYGFNKNEDKKGELIIYLPPDRTHAASGSDLIELNTAEDFRQKYLELIQTTKKRLAIFTLDLEPAIFDNEAMVDALSQLISRSRYTEIRILVKDTQSVLQRGNAVLRLYQRTDTQLSIKKLTVNPDSFTSAYVLSDDKGIIFRKDESVYRGAYYVDNRGRVKSQLEEFNQLWNSAISDPDLKRANI